MNPSYVPTVSSLAYCAVALYHSAPQIWGVQLQKNKLELRRHGVAVKLPQQTVDFCQKVLDDIALSPQHEANLTFFQVDQPWIISRGAVMHLTGGIIGLPTSFNDITSDERVTSRGSPPNGDDELGSINDEKKVTENSDADKYRDPYASDVSTLSTRGADARFDQINGTNDAIGSVINSDSETIVMSDHAKRFALATEIYGVSTYHLLVENAIGISLFIGAYVSGSSVRQLSRLKKWARVSVYNLLGALAISSYCVFSGKYHQRRRLSCDKKAIALGPSYAAGAVEFCEKLDEFQRSRDADDDGKSLRARARAFIASLRTVPTGIRLCHVQNLTQHDSLP